MAKTYQNFKSLKNWAEDDRPREKLMLKGKASLSDAELLAIIMGSGNKEETAVDLAKRILNDVQNNWHELSRLSLKQLMNYKGIGEAKAISIITALEIGNRKSLQFALEKPKVTSSSEVFDVLRPHLADLNVEEFWVMFLNQANKVISIERVSSGGISYTLADPRLIFRTALEKFATAIIVAHNHPSGNIKPSEQDIRLTKKLVECGQILDVAVLDHLIVTQKDYFSFRDENKM
ncbi:DNA repair protein RadC [Weeksellaceae bacterium KMM 9724]|uniref:RadC family protein n=1 Tax=Profundicola chukchiensis TaxID=2961959 RepID=UPI0024399F55|nr:DNA repair protein RadC [Profundicola chukchiensis]MDG4950302.1 DNA repair protein RadC [Profundicola chukchiensis]